MTTDKITKNQAIQLAKKKLKELLPIQVVKNLVVEMVDIDDSDFWNIFFGTKRFSTISTYDGQFINHIDVTCNEGNMEVTINTVPVTEDIDFHFITKKVSLSKFA